MEAAKIAKQMIDFQKAAFDNAYTSVIMVQDQTERMASAILDQTIGVPEEGRKMMDEWVGAYKSGRDEFKKAVDDNFIKFATMFEDLDLKTRAKAPRKEAAKA